jgi:hypothetical protein
MHEVKANGSVSDSLLGTRRACHSRTRGRHSDAMIVRVRLVQHGRVELRGGTSRTSMRAPQAQPLRGDLAAVAENAPLEHVVVVAFREIITHLRV